MRPFVADLLSGGVRYFIAGILFGSLSLFGYVHGYDEGARAPTVCVKTIDDDDAEIESALNNTCQSGDLDPTFPRCQPADASIVLRLAQDKPR